jgi:hypothetical protein
MVVTTEPLFDHLRNTHKRRMVVRNIVKRGFVMMGVRGGTEIGDWKTRQVDSDLWGEEGERNCGVFWNVKEERVVAKRYWKRFWNLI